MIAKAKEVLSTVASEAGKLFSKDSQGDRVLIHFSSSESFEANLGNPEAQAIRLFGKTRKMPFWPLEDCEYENAGILCVASRQAERAGNKEPFQARLLIAGVDQKITVGVRFIENEDEE